MALQFTIEKQINLYRPWMNPWIRIWRFLAGSRILVWSLYNIYMLIVGHLSKRYYNKSIIPPCKYKHSAIGRSETPQTSINGSSHIDSCITIAISKDWIGNFKNLSVTFKYPKLKFNLTLITYGVTKTTSTQSFWITVGKLTLVQTNLKNFNNDFYCIMT